MAQAFSAAVPLHTFDYYQSAICLCSLLMSVVPYNRGSCASKHIKPHVRTGYATEHVSV